MDKSPMRKNNRGKRDKMDKSPIRKKDRRKRDKNE